MPAIYPSRSRDRYTKSSLKQESIINKLAFAGKKLKLIELYFFLTFFLTNMTATNDGFILKVSKRADDLVEERIHLCLASR